MFREDISLEKVDIQQMAGHVAEVDHFWAWSTCHFKIKTSIKTNIQITVQSTSMLQDKSDQGYYGVQKRLNVIILKKEKNKT